MKICQNILGYEGQPYSWTVKLNTRANPMGCRNGPTQRAVQSASVSLAPSGWLISDTCHWHLCCLCSWLTSCTDGPSLMPVSDWVMDDRWHWWVTCGTDGPTWRLSLTGDLWHWRANLMIGPCSVGAYLTGHLVGPIPLPIRSGQWHGPSCWLM